MSTTYDVILCAFNAQLKERPSGGSRYWLPEVRDGKAMAKSMRWTDCKGDAVALRCGMAHATDQSAVAHAMAIIELTGAGASHD